MPHAAKRIGFALAVRTPSKTPQNALRIVCTPLAVWFPRFGSRNVSGAILGRWNSQNDPFPQIEKYGILRARMRLSVRTSNPLLFFISKTNNLKKKKKDPLEPSHRQARTWLYHSLLPHVLAVFSNSQDSLRFLSEWNLLKKPPFLWFFIFLFFYFKKWKVQKIKTKTKNAPKKFGCVEVREFLY